MHNNSGSCTFEQELLKHLTSPEAQQSHSRNKDSLCTGRHGPYPEGQAAAVLAADASEKKNPASLIAGKQNPKDSQVFYLAMWLEMNACICGEKKTVIPYK